MSKTVITARVEQDVLDLIDRIVAAQGRSRSWFAAKALKRAAEEEAAYLAFVQEGIDALDRGDVVPHEEVMAELESLLKRKAFEGKPKAHAA